MSLPTDLAHEVAERAPQPDFGVVVDRARSARRRRRTAVASGVAASVVVVAVVALPGLARIGDDRSAPRPATPGPTEGGTTRVDDRLPDDVQALLGQEDLHPWAVAGSGTGVAVVWRTCPGGPSSAEACRFVLATRRGDDVSGSEIRGPRVRLAAVPGGWLLQNEGSLGVVLAGGRPPVVDTVPGNADVMAGDTAVETDDGPRLLRGTKLLDLPGGDAWQPTGSYVTPAGRLVLAPGVEGPRRVVTTDDSGRTWTMTHVADPDPESRGTGLLAGNGDHLAHVLVGDRPDGSAPVVEVALSSDGGATWTSVPARAWTAVGEVSDVSGLAVSAQGTAYVTTGSHGLVRVGAGGDVAAMPQSPHDMAAFATDDEVCVVAEAGRVDRLRCSTDDGATWASQPLPGFG